MTKNINIEVSDDDFKELKKIKKRLGMTWEGVLKRGNLDDSR